ncbi:MAG: phosphopantothenoylcysteine synthase [Candidatus Altiarchaeota archaeon]|nr:phosphopantothenoylcysteine synthase [Candidatus Altiarchaeota archaeon]
MKVLITLGPTQEPIDSVRYVTTGSSGKMGAALAEEALSRGHDVTLIAGPVHIELPEDARIYRVRTAAEMTSTTLKELEDGFNVFICTAAIADYSPVKAEGKMVSGLPDLRIELKANPKLTREARKKFPDLHIVGFKAEWEATEEELAEKALAKLRGEDLDMVAANDIEANRFGSDYTEIILVDREGNRIKIARDAKENVAKKMWDEMERDAGI